MAGTYVYYGILSLVSYDHRLKTGNKRKHPDIVSRLFPGIGVHQTVMGPIPNTTAARRLRHRHSVRRSATGKPPVWRSRWDWCPAASR